MRVQGWQSDVGLDVGSVGVGMRVCRCVRACADAGDGTKGAGRVAAVEARAAFTELEQDSVKSDRKNPRVSTKVSGPFQLCKCRTRGVRFSPWKN